MNNNAVTSFLYAARRRLWLEAVLHQMRMAVWVSSAAIVLLALVHIGWSPVPLRFALVGALLAGLVALAPSLFRRPRLGDCALRADRHFGGHSLITTAHELGQETDSQPAARTVLARATSAAADWRPRLGTLGRKPPGSTLVLAAVPAFFAALLLELPPKGDSVPATDDAQSGVPGSLETKTNLFDVAGNLPGLRDAIASSASDKAGSAQPETVTGDSFSPVSRDARTEGASEVAAPRAADAPPGFASAAQEGGQSPGDARRSPGEIERSPDESGPLFSGREDVAIDRYGTAAAGRADGDYEFATRSTDVRDARPNIAPAPAPPVSSAWTTLTAAEVAYARRYLDAAGVPSE